MYGLSKRSIVNRMSDLFDDFEVPMFPQMFGNVDLFEAANPMPVKISEGEDLFKVEAVLPGLEKDEIDVTYERNILTIKVESKSDKKESNKNRVILDERPKITYSREFIVHGLDINQAKASLKNGVLELTLPKTDEVKPKKILVK